MMGVPDGGTKIEESIPTAFVELSTVVVVLLVKVQYASPHFVTLRSLFVASRWLMTGRPSAGTAIEVSEPASPVLSAVTVLLPEVQLALPHLRTLRLVLVVS